MSIATTDHFILAVRGATGKLYLSGVDEIGVPRLPILLETGRPTCAVVAHRNRVGCILSGGDVAVFWTPGAFSGVNRQDAHHDKRWSRVAGSDKLDVALDEAGVLHAWSEHRDSPDLRLLRQVEESWPDRRFRDVAVSDDAVVLIDAETGFVLEWWSNHRPVWPGDRVEAPRDVPVERLTAGADLFAAIDARTNEAIVWGARAADPVSTKPADLGAVSAISAGSAHVVAVERDTGRVICWGENRHRQCDVPENLGPVSEIVAGANRTVALERQGGTLCVWGNHLDQPSERQGEFGVRMQNLPPEPLANGCGLTKSAARNHNACEN